MDPAESGSLVEGESLILKDLSKSSGNPSIRDIMVQVVRRSLA